MAKGKGKPNQSDQDSEVLKEVVTRPQIEVIESDPERFSAFEYLVANAIFWIFCFLNLVVAKWFMGESTGLFFFFGVMALGFTAACLLSYLHDRFYRDDYPEVESP